AWPLELVNGSPTDVGLISEEIDALRREAGHDLFRGFDPTAYPRTTLPAMALATVAYRRDLATGEAVSLDLRSAVFEEGLDVADESVLSAIADRHEVPMPSEADLQAPVEDWHAGRVRGVVGSPHFFVGD